MKSISTVFIFGLIVMISVTGCNQSKSKKNTTTSTSFNPVTPPNPGFTPVPTPTPPATSTGQCYGTGNEAGVADAGQTINYYKLNNPPVVAHGAGAGVIVYNSETDLASGYSQGMFYTNSRFNVRVIPRRQYFGTDSKGVSCMYSPRPYSKLRVGVKLRKRESQAGDYYQFDDVAVDCASKVHEFQVPQGSAFPLIVEVSNIMWDWSCQSYTNQGFPNVAGVCPWDSVWTTECVQVEVQFSTDDTKDIPGTRTN